MFAQLLKYAKSDLAQARKRGVVGISQTKLGLLQVEYTNKRYTITAQNGGYVLAQEITAGEAAQLIALNYEVISA